MRAITKLAWKILRSDPTLRDCVTTEKLATSGTGGADKLKSFPAGSDPTAYYYQRKTLDAIRTVKKLETSVTVLYAILGVVVTLVVELMIR